MDDRRFRKIGKKRRARVLRAISKGDKRTVRRQERKEGRNVEIALA
jgi:hypothetical protein